MNKLENPVSDISSYYNNMRHFKLNDQIKFLEKF